MIEPWELMLHHSYTGSPGVIFDQSPGRTGHGTAVGLSASDFLPDGAEDGSGAIACHPGALVKVRPSTPWTHLSAIQCEVICSCDGDGSIGDINLISTDGFSLWVNDDQSPVFSYHSATGRHDIGRHYPIPRNQWFTLGATFNGLGRSSITVDGKEIFAADTHDGPTVPVTHITIGNSSADFNAWMGRIDDVKIWRYSPHWVDDSFTNRPVDPTIKDCWKRWSDALGNALRDDPKCAARVRQLIDAAVSSLIQRASAASTDATWQAAVVSYQQTWPTGDFGQLQAIMADIVAAIGGDLQLKTDPALAALANDPCMQKIAGQLPKLDCDQGFVDLVRNTAKQIEVL
jgi:concanavalin A-like lectin/glucanase superfamily protein